jgi:hypothetical protein
MIRLYRNITDRKTTVVVLPKCSFVVWGRMRHNGLRIEVVPPSALLKVRKSNEKLKKKDARHNFYALLAVRFAYTVDVLVGCPFAKYYFL